MCLLTPYADHFFQNGPLFRMFSVVTYLLGIEDKWGAEGDGNVRCRLSFPAEVPHPSSPRLLGLCSIPEQFPPSTRFCLT